MRLDHGAGRAILDPFHGGRTLGTGELRALLKSVAGQDAELTPAHYAPLGNRDILLRLQNNIKLRLQRDGQKHRALAVVERMLIVAPGATELWREAGAINAELENLRAAIDCLDTAIALAASGDARQRIAADRARLTGRLN